MRVATARGFRDVLPPEAAEREALVAVIGGVFDSWGYSPVETPVLEEYAVLEAAAGELEGTAFRLFDLDGRLLALRPEMTVPVARLAASKLLPEDASPQRLRYAAPVFREHASLRGQARQFTQIGVELLGAGGPEADAEIVALAIQALLAAGLSEHTVAIGNVEVLTSILDASAMPEEWRTEVLAAAHSRDLVGIDRLAEDPRVPPAVAVALRSVPRTRGSIDAVARCRELTSAFGCKEALVGLERVWSVIDALGLGERLSVDFGVMRGFDYYTGLVLEAYAPGVGAPVGGGGRYDNALACFGTPAPAAGFALGLERVHIAAAEQGRIASTPSLNDIVGGEDASAFVAAEALRRAGRRVALSCASTPAELAARAAREGARAILATDRSLALLAEDGSVAAALPWPVETGGAL